ncbi:hypothetical protein [Holdemanella biformis]|uniref:Uncharacterized protein n=1 Tax=Holdemanella biformis DSM 3989 TaxID=518637 RepID=B7C959_9FIRM|nr:hypothetical protein [Holdemanella biformis]EEC90636.1 hypothetical protein EUBIFOR_00716 [Holdemanella biformis DSM 3989]MBD8958150.1 hypothetical protein [Holdemanella biformis]HCR69638.1 hypothetical protein [Erysipelotrichaceae bacterium]
MFSLFLVFVMICVVVNVISGITGMYSYQSSEDDQFNQFQRNVQQQQFDEMNRHFTEESLKSVTPFEMGGYDMTQGNSWNNNDFGGMF